MRPTTVLDDNVFDFDALLHPGTAFEHPRDVVAHPNLSLAEKRAIVASWASDPSAIASCPALQAPITIDEILVALCALDGGPRHPPGGKPMRLRSIERRAAAQRGKPDRLESDAVSRLHAQRRGRRRSHRRDREEALAKASEFIEGGHRDVTFKDLLGNVLDRAVVVTLAKIEDRRCALRLPPMTFRIGIISDTHGLLRPEAERRLAGVDHIIHGGDIGRPEIIDALRRIAPVAAIRGNVDIGDWAAAYPETEVVRLAGRSIYVLHDLKTLHIDPVARGIEVVVSGHSHVPKIDTAGGVLYLNPGSAGRRRFRLPVTLATIDVTPNGLRPVIHTLGDA
jgi:putative phosphoesterase